MAVQGRIAYTLVLYFVARVSSDYCNTFGARTPCGELEGEVSDIATSQSYPPIISSAVEAMTEIKLTLCAILCHSAIHLPLCPNLGLHAI